MEVTFTVKYWGNVQWQRENTASPCTEEDLLVLIFFSFLLSLWLKEMSPVPPRCNSFSLDPSRDPSKASGQPWLQCPAAPIAQALLGAC